MRQRTSVFSLAGLLVTMVLATSCSSAGSTALQRLDPMTGVTITRATKPVILYRDRSAQAAHAKDFVYLGPLQVNNMGERRYFLWLGIWGTSDSREDTLDDFETIVVYADGEPLTLEAKGWTLSAIGASEPVYTKPVAAASDAYYSVTIDQIRLIAEARDIELRAGGARPHHYLRWDLSDSGNEAVVSFLRHVN